MSYVFPTTLHKDNTVLDWAEFNEQIASYANVVDGGISEHNLSPTLGVDLRAAQKLSSNFALRIFNAAVAVDPIAGTLTIIPETEQWYPIAGSTTTVRSNGGELLVYASFQTKIASYVTDAPGLQFCLELDGAPRLNTLLGSGDMGNERLNSDTVDNNQIPVDSGVSIKASYSAHCLEGVFTVDPGAHVVRLLARNPYTTRDGTAPLQYVGSVEIIATATWS